MASLWPSGYAVSHGNNQPFLANRSTLEFNPYTVAGAVPPGLAARRAHDEQLARFFGQPKRPIVYNPENDYDKEHEDLPDAYEGVSLRLRKVMIDMITEAELYPIKVMFPLEEHSGSMDVSWDIIKFNQHHLNRQPEESVPRLLSFTRDTGRESFVRYGIGLMLEHGFYKTPKGRECYLMHLQQIRNATVETLAYGAMHAAVNHQKYRDRNDIYRQTAARDKNSLDRIFFEERNNFAQSQKTAYGLQLAEKKLSDIMINRNGHDADFIVVPKGIFTTMPYRDENRLFFMNGQSGGPPSESAMKSRYFNGKRVEESRPFRMPDHRPGDDPCFRHRTIGGWFHMVGAHLRNVDAVNWRTEMLDTIIFSRAKDNYVRLYYADIARYLGLYNWDSVSMQWTPLGRSYFSKSNTVTHGEYALKAGMLDRMVETIHSWGEDPAKHPKLFRFLEQFAPDVDREQFYSDALPRKGDPNLPRRHEEKHDLKEDEFGPMGSKVDLVDIHEDLSTSLGFGYAGLSRSAFTEAHVAGMMDLSSGIHHDIDDMESLEDLDDAAFGIHLQGGQSGDQNATANQEQLLDEPPESKNEYVDYQRQYQISLDLLKSVKARLTDSTGRLVLPRFDVGYKNASEAMDGVVKSELRVILEKARLNWKDSWSFNKMFDSVYQELFRADFDYAVAYAGSHAGKFLTPYEKFLISRSSDEQAEAAAISETPVPILDSVSSASLSPDDAPKLELFVDFNSRTKAPILFMPGNQAVFLTLARRFPVLLNLDVSNLSESRPDVLRYIRSGNTKFHMDSDLSCAAQFWYSVSRIFSFVSKKAHEARSVEAFDQIAPKLSALAQMLKTTTALAPVGCSSTVYSAWVSKTRENYKLNGFEFMSFQYPCHDILAQLTEITGKIILNQYSDDKKSSLEHDIMSVLRLMTHHLSVGVVALAVKQGDQGQAATGGGVEFRSLERQIRVKFGDKTAEELSEARVGAKKFVEAKAQQIMQERYKTADAKVKENVKKALTLQLNDFREIGILWDTDPLRKALFNAMVLLAKLSEELTDENYELSCLLMSEMSAAPLMQHVALRYCLMTEPFKPEECETVLKNINEALKKSLGDNRIPFVNYTESYSTNRGHMEDEESRLIRSRQIHMRHLLRVFAFRFREAAALSLMQSRDEKLDALLSGHDSMPNLVETLKGFIRSSFMELPKWYHQMLKFVATTGYHGLTGSDGVNLAREQLLRLMVYAIVRYGRDNSLSIPDGRGVFYSNENFNRFEKAFTVRLWHMLYGGELPSPGAAAAAARGRLGGALGGGMVPPFAVPGAPASDRVFKGVPVAVIRQIIMKEPISKGHFFRFCINENVPPAFGILGFRPHKTFDMGTLIYMNAGKAGRTWFGHADFMLSDDAARKMHYGNFSLYAKTVIVFNQYICLFPDIYCRDYILGDGHDIWDPLSEEHVEDYGSGENMRDIFLVPVPMNHDVSRTSYMDITGRFSDTLCCDENTQGLTAYDSAEAYRDYWGWRHTIHPNTEDASRGIPKSNTVVFQEQQYLYNHANGKFDFKIADAGHWGDENIYEGCTRVLKGAEAMFRGAATACFSQRGGSFVSGPYDLFASGMSGLSRPVNV